VLMDDYDMLPDAQDDFSGLLGLTVARLRNVGEAALRGNHYTEAIRAFDQALAKAKTQNSKDSRLDSMALLDLRVEARLRMNKYYRASKDAGTMIRLDRTDARGYFRLGQIKQMQGDCAAALNVYSTGLRHVSLDSPLRHMLRTKHESTLRAISLSKSTDPFTVLPPELLQMVLSHFDYSEATAIARVSKNWRDVIVSLPAIQTTLDFSGHHKPISKTAFNACIRRLSRPPSVVIAEKLSNPAISDLRKRLALWISPTHLELRNVSIDIRSINLSASLEVLVVGEQQNLDQAQVCRILSLCSFLRRASFSSVMRKANDYHGNNWIKDMTACAPHMHSLTIQGLLCGLNSPERLIWPTSFFNQYPELRELNLSNMDLRPQALQPPLDFSTLGRLRSLIMNRVNVDDFPALPSALEVLKCHAWLSRVSAWPAHFNGITQPGQVPQWYLTRLHTIQFVGMGDQILSPLRHLPPMGETNALTELDLYECQIGLGNFLRLIERGLMREVKSLRLSFPDLDDDHLDSFLVHLRSLEKLVLINTRITGVFVKGLITVPGCQLRHLGLGGLVTRVSIDVIEWAQKRGVEVHWNDHGYSSFGVG
jgi:tetratricopeptide (TPR) repeat protein